MSAEDRLRWNKTYQSRDMLLFPAPDPLLKEFTPSLPPEKAARALDLAAGVGQNGLWLAEQGYATDIMDISRVALNRARAEMGFRNLRNVNLLQVDVDTLQIEPGTYDLICVFRYLKRDLFGLLKQSVKSGGRVIYETFNINYLYEVPGFNKAYLLKTRELASYFDDWYVLHDEEVDHISRIVAVKP